MDARNAMATEHQRMLRQSCMSGPPFSRCCCALRELFGSARMELDLAVYLTGFRADLKRECGHLLLGEADESISPIVVDALQEDVTCMAPIHKLADSNGADICVKNVKHLVRLVDERSNISIYVPEVRVHCFSLKWFRGFVPADHSFRFADTYNLISICWAEADSS